MGPKAKPATPPTPGPHARDLDTSRSETGTHPDLGFSRAHTARTINRTHSAVVAAGRASAREQADDHSPSLQATTSTQR
ncbi:hypothetical protein P7K49_039656 [Saguinus oedipus]|uniref:Uncharacterized protein n=1 Tax=Saguinus oedipus TaxID=9490 RepID=A0ABQ9TBI2_SAGOE|nr:hypothetical protein P7K49_039655 [Saguinus oedipus]KAK2082086.1 hypothetical protein P7K49_039656 [Saguinus oedipus]